MGVLYLACLLLTGTVTFAIAKTYKGHHVLSAKASTEEQLTVLRNLEDQYDLVYLTEPSVLQSTDMAVPPDQKVQILDTMREAGINVTVLSSDLQAEIDAEARVNLAQKWQRQGTLQRSSRLSPAHFYRTLSEVNDVMAEFASTYPHLAARKQMNWTTEGDRRPVYYLELGTARDNNGNSSKPVIFIEGLAHAREWIGTASLIYVVDRMLSGFVAHDADMVAALTTYTWVIIPVVNPDGYHYTWTTDRMWRKNRKFISNRCRGVDLNRNYDVDFANTGVSFKCESETYPGPAPFSEAESRNVADLFRHLKDRVVAFLSVHAYSQLLLYPWGYIESYNPSQVPSNIDKLMSVGQKMKEALDSQGRWYDLGTAYGVLGYAASGAAEDWALQEKPGIYSYCYELRPSDYTQGGFILPPSQIVPTGKELLKSLLVLANNI